MHKSISTWKKWSPVEAGPGGRISGSVCGLDPKFCEAPASVAPFEWPDDITQWPICRKPNSFSQRSRYKDTATAEHMVCEVIGHPCCTGVYGECRITTREFCDFVYGYFHEEASLCSQVSCLNDVCGMFPFFTNEIPDQFYRLFSSLCLHAGVLHLAITVAFQHVFMTDLERLMGPVRMAIVYIGSGVAGNLTSVLFMPYRAEVGPLASLAGVVAAFLVQLICIHWNKLKKPHYPLMKFFIIGGGIFGIGTLPWQQNCIGLIAGIIFGILLTLTLVPFLTIGKYSRKSKINLIWTCAIFHFAIYLAMFILFYLFPTTFSSVGGIATATGGAGAGAGTGIGTGTDDLDITIAYGNNNNNNNNNGVHFRNGILDDLSTGGATAVGAGSGKNSGGPASDIGGSFNGAGPFSGNGLGIVGIIKTADAGAVIQKVTKSFSKSRNDSNNNNNNNNNNTNVNERRIPSSSEVFWLNTNQINKTVITNRTGINPLYLNVKTIKSKSNNTINDGDAEVHFNVNHHLINDLRNKNSNDSLIEINKSKSNQNGGMNKIKMDTDTDMAMDMDGMDNNPINYTVRNAIAINRNGNRNNNNNNNNNNNFNNNNTKSNNSTI